VVPAGEGSLAVDVYVDPFEPSDPDPLKIELEATHAFEIAEEDELPVGWAAEPVPDLPAAPSTNYHGALEADIAEPMTLADLADRGRPASEQRAAFYREYAASLRIAEQQARQWELRLMASEQVVVGLKDELRQAVESAANLRLALEQQAEDHATEMEEMERRLELAHTRLENYRLTAENAALMKENIGLAAFRRAIENLTAGDGR
jgi:hypothetical protein